MRATDYRPPTHQVIDFHLDFIIHSDHCVVKSKFRIKPFSTTQLQSEIQLDGVQLQLKTVKVDQQLRSPASYAVTDERLTIFNLNSLEQQIEIETILDPYNNKSLEGLYYSNGILCTQCEAQSFRKITYFMDRPDVMTTYEVRIEADRKKFPVLLANGNLTSAGECGDGRHFVVWKDPSKKPCYLFAMVAGDLSCIEDQFKTASGRDVRLQFYASADKIQQCHFALESLKHAMTWDEEVFALEYDLDQYMVVSIDDFNAGAMENKGLNIFNSRFVLADRESATDEDFEHIESVIAHEYFHNYSGNRITLRDWFHLSLKEGLTVFRDQEFSADRLGTAIQRVSTVNVLKSKQFTEDAGPNRHPVLPFEGKAVDNFFTATIYEKGAEVIRMIQVILGKPLFREILKKYFQKFDGQAITILDFVQHFQEESGYDFTQFKNWYFQSGTPKVEVQKSRQGDCLKLVFKQNLGQCSNHHVLNEHGQPTPALPYVIPIVLESDHLRKEILSAHKNMRLNSESQFVFIFDQRADEVVLPLNADQPISLFKNFSAPVLIETHELFEDQIHQLAAETDGFNSFEIAQALHCNLLLTVEMSTQSLQLFARSLIKKINQESMLPGMKAKLLSLPSFQALSTQLTLFEPDELMARVYKYQHFLAAELHSTLKSQLMMCQKAISAAGAAGQNYSPQMAGFRSYEFHLLDYISFVDPQYVQEIASAKVRTQANFTDVSSGLKLLIASQDQFPLEIFLKEISRWSANSLVQSKLFKLVSMASKESIIDALSILMKHPLYDQGNPNHVYSMVRSFFENYVIFHHSKYFEKNYRLLVEQLKFHDQSNPQVAARLAVAFQLNAKLPPRQKARMKEHLIQLKTHMFSQNLNEKMDQALGSLY